MPNIFKNLPIFQAEPYQFPDADSLSVDEQASAPLHGAEQLELLEKDGSESGLPVAANSIDFATAQADAIIRDARRQAEEIVKNASDRARERAEEIAEIARAEGRQEGYAQGMVKAQEEMENHRRELVVILQNDVQEFLERAEIRLDEQMDQNVEQLRDLAITIAEKVVGISLKSSSEVVARMIQAAVDKRKRTEWANIYIAECDAKQLTQISPALRISLSALSERVRIIPMVDDESGTCIIEMPDQIIDASAATQLNNIRELLMEFPGRKGAGLF